MTFDETFRHVRDRFVFMLIGMIGIFVVWTSILFYQATCYIDSLELVIDAQDKTIQELENELLNRIPSLDSPDLDFHHEFKIPPTIKEIEQDAKKYWSA